MTFFEDPTVVNLIEQNIAQVDALEEKQQLRLLRAFRKVRQELQDRLLTIPEGTFTEQQLSVTLVQVQAAIEAIKRRLKGEIATSSEILAERGIKDLVREIERFSKKFEGSVQPININIAALATESQTFLLNKHEASLDAYGEDLRAQLTQNIMNAMIMRDTSERTVSRLVADVGRFFIGEEWKLNRIVRTEMHNIYNYSKMNAMAGVQETTLPDLKKSLMHPMDSRTGEDSKALAKQNPVLPIGEPFVQKWKGKTYTFMFPPQRPNDRAILVPFREAWGKRAAIFGST